VLWVFLMFGMSATAFFGHSLLRRYSNTSSGPPSTMLMRIRIPLHEKSVLPSVCVQAYCAHEIALMFQQSVGTFKFPSLDRKSHDKELISIRRV